MPNPDLERRLAALEQGYPRQRATKPRQRSRLALIVVASLLAGSTALYILARSGDERALPTATPDEFQAEGEGFGEVAPLEPPAAPEPEIVLVEPAPTEPNAELLAQIATLQAEIEALKAAPAAGIETDAATAEAIEALTARIAALQAASEAAQTAFQDELAARDRELRQLRTDLDLALLEAKKPAPAPTGVSEEELRAQEEEARRLAELERRAAQQRAFQDRRIGSPLLAFGGAGGTTAGETALTEATFDAATDFVRNGARPSEATQAKVIANPSNTVSQGTMIQAVMETALDSSLPGQTRAVISEDVFSHDGTRLLIPRGSRLIGRYRAGVEIGARRVTIAWDRILLPSNQSITISAFGGDALGRSGVTGRVDTRFAKRFGSAALISILSAAPRMATGRVGDENAASLLEDIGDDLNDATDSVTGDYLSLGPVIQVDPGARVTVMVDRDLEIF